MSLFNLWNIINIHHFLEKEQMSPLVKTLILTLLLIL